MPGLGWMLTRRLYEEIAPKWPDESEKLAWDEWLRIPAQKKGRLHCTFVIYLHTPQHIT